MKLNTRLLAGFLACSFLTGAGAPRASADVKPASIFGDNMVLQRDKPDLIWGTASPHEAVTVSFDQASVRAEADASGAWRVQLPSHAAGGPYDLTLTAANTVTLHNVLVGEVWLCSGQSNMAGTVKSMLRPDAFAQEMTTADHPRMRLFTVKRNTSAVPLTDVVGQWQVCDSTSAPGFSATAYFFGKELERALNVPIGLINSSVGGTKSEAWTELSALDADPSYEIIKERWNNVLADYPVTLARYQSDTLPRWQAAAAAARAAGKPIPMRPNPPEGPDSPNRPANLFNAMIAPLVPLTIRGVTWYQGESNSDTISDANRYKTLFPTLIADWRRLWNDPNLPFVFCQLANYQDVQTQPAESSSWPITRETQTNALALPATGMAVLVDIKDSTDGIHPHNKQETGRRLALAALGTIYKQPIVYSGPVYQSMSIEGNRIRIRFKFADGLAAKARPGVAEDGKLQGFAISGPDHVFRWGDAVIDGDSVVVSSPLVSNPVAVRYDWAMNPIGNLYNGAGLPAGPFRTDPKTPEPVPPTAIVDGVLTNCLTTGRFGASSVDEAMDKDFIGEATADPSAGQISGGKPWVLANVLNRDRFNLISLDETGPSRAYAAYFSFRINSADDAGAAPIGMSVIAVKTARLLVNGALAAPAQSTAWGSGTRLMYPSLPLKKGWNTLIIKVAGDSLSGPEAGMIAVRFTGAAPVSAVEPAQ